MKQIICILLICLAVALIVGCRAAEKEAEPTTAAEDVSDIEGDISDIEGLDEELDLSELENLEQELEEVDW